MKKICFFTLMILSGMHYSLFCQENYDKNLLETATPVEPTTASLGQYGVFPVDFSNGLITIKIPLFEINTGELVQPIELTYHGGGIKVTEEATWVGLGWNVNFGGVISRTLQGFPDQEETSPLPDASYLLAQMRANYNTTNNVIDYDELNKARTPELSFKPDLYHYNFGEYTGTFFLQNSEIRPVSYNTLKGSLTKITVPDGTTYEFLGSETTNITRKLMPVKIYGSAYYIGKITSPNRTDTISYSYQSDGVYTSILQSYVEGLVTTTATPLVLGVPSPTPSPTGTTIETLPLRIEQMSIQKVTSVKPQYIHFAGGRVSFHLSERLDLDPISTGTLKKLDYILIEKKEGASYSPVKVIKFYYSYFNPSGDYDHKRLCLDSLVELPSLQSSERQLIAAFSYCGNKTLPAKNSYASDFWGFYNGKNNNSPIPLTNFSPYTFGSADKNPDEYYTQYGTIKSIIYPTKGKTEFIWEGNKISHTSSHTIPYLKKDATLFFSPTSDILCYNDSPSFYSKSMTVRSLIDQTVIIEYYLRKKDVLDPIHKRKDRGEISLNGEIITNFLSTNTTSQKFYFRLKANVDYTFTIKTNCSNVEGSLRFSYNSFDPTKDTNTSYPFAGIRIKEVKNYDTDGELLTHKKYEYTDPAGKPSGMLTHDKPISYYKKTTLFDEGSVADDIFLYTIDKDLVYSNQFSGMEANNYMYEYVKEFNLDDTQNTANGYTLYQFSKGSDIFYNSDIPLINQSHLRGRLINQKDYKKTSVGYELIREVQNIYHQDARISYSIKGFAMSQNYEFTGPDALSHGLGSIDQTMVFNPVNYEYTSDWITLDKSIIKNYSTPSAYATTSTEYLYNNIHHIQPTEIKKTNSAGEILKTRILYPSDMNTGIFIEMVNKNMLTYPIDTKKYIVRVGQTDKLIGGRKKLYEKDVYNHIVHTKESEYLPSGALNDLFTYKFNQKTRLIEITGKDNIPISIYWDMVNRYPIVMAKNMSYDVLSNAMSANFSPLTFPTSAVCLNAQVTTYTYQPFVGMASETDSHGVTIYYEYDSFGRLQHVKDSHGKMIKQYEYHYKP